MECIENSELAFLQLHFVLKYVDIIVRMKYKLTSSLQFQIKVIKVRNKVNK